MFENLKGKTISFEGGEGTGKSTLIKNLVSYFEKNAVLDILATREPGGVNISEQIREIIVSKENKEICPETEALLFAASRAQFMNQVIKPALKEEKTILIDRFVDSSLAYQGVGRKLGVENIMSINKMATSNWLPDLTIVLDIDPEVGLKRISDNNRTTNRLDEEDLSFYNDIREAYLDFARMYPERIIVIDASKTPEEVLEVVLKILELI